MQGENIKLNKGRVFLAEDDFADKMMSEVSPVLDSSRKTGYFHSFDDTEIFYEYFLNPQEKAAIVISHGFCEFTAKFEEVVYYFYQEGYSVFLFDYRGHGYSGRSVEDGSKVHVHSYSEYVLDLHNFITKIVRKSSLSKRMVLYAHSMGGAIAALYLERFPEVFCCTILSSPMLKINFSVVPKFLIWLILSYKKVTRADDEYVLGHRGFDCIPVFETSSCSSKARYDYMFAKRLHNIKYQTYGGTYAWTLASMEAVNRLQRQAYLVKRPILLFQAGCDTTVKPEGQIRFAQKSEDTQLVVMPTSKHEIYNADTKTIEVYYNKIFDFLEEKLGHLK